MYSLKRVGIFNIPSIFKVTDILYLCGKDMAEKYDLHHWDNPRIKTLIIAVLCVLKNEAYLVCDGDALATFQVKKQGDTIHFEKLAVSPKASGKGIGSFCLESIEKIGKAKGCTKVGMDVYSPSRHAIDFYTHRGYKVCGETKSLKYSEIKMEKEIEE